MNIKKRVMIFVVLTFSLLIVLSLNVQAATGCYYYPEASDDYYCQTGLAEEEAETDCANYLDCDFDQYFTPNLNCQELEVCEPIKCNIDCLTWYQGKCIQEGGQEVPFEDENEWCNPGCCIIDRAPFCNFVNNLYMCKETAQNLLGGIYQEGDENYVSGISRDECQLDYCSTQYDFGEINGNVVDIDGNVVENANVVLVGKNIGPELTSSDGNYQFTELIPGNYQVQVSLSGYYPESQSITLESGETETIDFILTLAEGAGKISGTVTTTDSSGNTIFLENVRISYSGAIDSFVNTNSSGNYLIEDLPYGNYVLEARKISYSSSTNNVVLSEQVQEEVVNFDLSQEQLLLLEGTTYLDSNGNRQLEVDIDQTQAGAKIYLDSSQRAYSRQPNGRFEIEINQGFFGQEHAIFATYGENYVSETKTFTINEEDLQLIDILLFTYISQCTELQAVDDLNVQPVPGEKKLDLTWTKPCQDVIGYDLTIFDSDNEQTGKMTLEPNQFHFEDINVEWGENYTYTMVAVYPGVEFSEPVTVTANVGNALCESRFTDGRPETFCLNEDVYPELDEKRWKFSCNNFNELFNMEDCSEYDWEEAIYYCAAISSTEADCKDINICYQDGGLFGLFYDSEICYQNKKFCLFDYTNNLVDECKSCNQTESCFDYIGQEACEINRCLEDRDCQWINGAEDEITPIVNQLFEIPQLVTEETGKGYCAEIDYQKDDQCSLCGPQAVLFENYFCTSDICSALGDCYSDYNLKSCQTCGEYPTDEGCHSYQTELECTGKPSERQGIEINSRGEITFSNDNCNWGRCAWLSDDNGNGQCVKDGDGNNINDCESSEINTQLCKKDITAPITSLISENSNIISTVVSEIIFFGDDGNEQPTQQSKMKELWYCLTGTSQDKCDLNINSEAFKREEYEGRTYKEEVNVNLLDYFLSLPLNEHPNGETYALKFYSLDEFYNQEDVRKEFVYIDVVAPEFELDVEQDTDDDLTTLSVDLLGVNELISCNYILKENFPGNSRFEVSLPVEETNKEIIFDQLSGISYTLNVTCWDDYGNQKEVINVFTFDIEPNIDIINPELYGFVSETEIVFEVETLISANCKLYKDDVYVTEFNAIDTESKVHQTDLITGFVPGEYPASYKVLCKSQLDNQDYSDYFHFTVDIFGPETVVVLKEGDVVVEIPQWNGNNLNYGWEEFFVNQVEVSFECNTNTFECTGTYYCLNDDCDDDNYEEVTSSLILNETTRMCYYSENEGNTFPYILCGTVNIDGYGITLEKPKLHYFNSEQWGISNKPIFDWQFYTVLPTSECHIGFISGFNYDNVPDYLIKYPNSDNKYLIEDFPNNTATSGYSSNGGVKRVYVKCDNGFGEIGPEQLMNLEYDPSAPVIEDAYANPDLIIEGIITNLFVNTNDKTFCRYSDNSEDTGSEEYGTMEYSFPGLDENILYQSHQDKYVISFLGQKKDYVFSTICKNGAGNFSELKNISFEVDYTQLGNIISVSPSGYLDVTEVTLEVETSKSGVCEYKENGTYIEMNGTGSLYHSVELKNLEEKKYIIPIRCKLPDDHTVETQIEFTIDHTPPKITNIDDGNYSCGNDHITVFVSTDEESIGAYYYEVYESSSSSSSSRSYRYSSNTTSSSSSSGDTLLFNDTVGNEQPIKISIDGLNESKDYYVKVRAGDSAGNWGEFAESNGFKIIDRNNSLCQDELGIKINVEETCTAKLVEIECKSDVGCDEINYGKDATLSSCDPLDSYTGKLTYEQTGWLCYLVKNNLGETKTGNEKIVIPDEDDDGILDACDLCPDTYYGKVVDSDGCSDNQVDPEKDLDTDGDNLPDSWEKINYGDDCQLHYASVDTNDNGVSDDQEDYDGDGYTNYEEFLRGSDPCLSDKRRIIDDDDFDTEDDFDDVEEKPDYLAWIFFILGLLLVLGGTGYLIYYYKYSPQQKFGNRQIPKQVNDFNQPFAQQKQTSQQTSWKDSLFNLKKKREDKIKERSRKDIFSSFSKKSDQIPHLDRFLNKKVDHQKKVEQLADHYVKYKEDLKPGLKPAEKSIFNRLEEISKQKKTVVKPKLNKLKQSKSKQVKTVSKSKKKTKPVVNKKEAQDIFAKLKNISEKRKK